MAYSVIAGSFESLEDAWMELLPQCAPGTIFVDPRWQRLWWKHFGGDRELLLLGIYHDRELIGIAPLMAKGQCLALIGSTEVCDYRDLVLLEQHCTGAFEALLAYLDGLSWSTFVLHSLSGASSTLAYLRQLGEARRYEVTLQQEDVCPRVDLPSDWESYLSRLGKKDRHELRRKFRRLTSAGSAQFYSPDGHADLERDLDDFLRLHRDSREEKAAFMTPEKEAFFRDVVATLVPQGLAKLSFVEVDGVRAAAILCFDYAQERLLYNSGYDLTYSSLSVGLLLKAHALQEAIEAGMRRFDFLRGDEPYKYDLGGVDYPIYQCIIRRP